jgi:electron transfer flavoprotein beta subunit
MNIFVCVKQVPDTSQSLKITPEGTGIVEDGLEMVINPYDEYAIEEALLIKERLKSGTVTLVTVGPERCQKALRAGLAMGADEAVHICDPVFALADNLVVARILAAYLKRQSCDLVWTGKQAVDDDCSMVPQALAELLGMPFAPEIKKFELGSDARSVTLHREIDGGSEVVTSPLPAVLSAQKGLNKPRYASLKGIMASKKKTIKMLSAADLGLDASSVGPQAAKVRIRKIEYPPPRQGSVRLLGGDIASQVAEAARIIREDLKLV